MDPIWIMDNSIIINNIILPNIRNIFRKTNKQTNKQTRPLRVVVIL